MLSDDVLKHAGIKGMRWGVKRDRNRVGGADGKEESEKIKDTRGKVKKNLDSMKRERQWKSVLKDVDKLNTKDITAVTKRVTLENNLKKLSKSGIAKPKDRDDYLRRANMADDELSRKVVRLRAKDSLYKSVNEASKEQREFGQKIVQIASSVGVKYALNKNPTTAKSIFKDVLDASKKPKESSEKAKQDLLDATIDKINNN